MSMVCKFRGRGRNRINRIAYSNTYTKNLFLFSNSFRTRMFKWVCAFGLKKAVEFCFEFSLSFSSEDG